jgi:hypothetical protein
MVAHASFFRQLTGPGLPCRLPQAHEVPAALCVREVVRHPLGGWTIAVPVDATTSAARIYAGNWSSYAAALAAMEGHG